MKRMEPPPPAREIVVWFDYYLASSLVGVVTRILERAFGLGIRCCHDYSILKINLP